MPWKPNVTRWFKPAEDALNGALHSWSASARAHAAAKQQLADALAAGAAPDAIAGPQKNGTLAAILQSGLALARLQAADEQQLVSEVAAGERRVANKVAAAEQQLLSLLPASPQNASWPLVASKRAAIEGLAAPVDPRVVNRSETALTLAWSPPTAATALDAAGAVYGVLCVTAGAGCTGPTVGAAPPPARSATTATVTGLPPATAATCYAYTDVPLKLKGGPQRVCSDAAAGTTRPPRPAIAAVFTALTSLGFRAYIPMTGPLTGRRRLAQASVTVDGVALTVKCVAAGGACDAASVGVVSQTTTPTNLMITSLPPLTRFSCYAVATAPDGTAVCSAPEDAFTGSAPTAPQALTAGAITSTSIALSWEPPLVPGAPSAQMGAICAQPTTSCSAALAGATVGSVPILLPNVTATTVIGLPPYTALVCWAVSSNAATLGNALCSASVSVTTAAIAPSPPVGLAATPISTTAIALNWTLGATPGVPVATQGGVCVAAGGACTDPPAGVAPAPSAGATNATVTGLSPGLQYTCYATAANVATAGPMCSVGVGVQTLQLPGPPTGLAATDVSTSSVALAWSLPSAPGVPRATTGAVCVAAGAACTAPPLGTAPAPAVGQTAARVTGLPAGLSITCYAAASNSQGSACSTGLAITTLAPPSLPLALTLVPPPGEYSLSFTWAVPASVGVPPAALGVTCVAAGQACTAPPAGASPPAAVGQTAGTVQGLNPNTTYSCFATAINTASPAPVCSTGVTATTATQSTTINIPPGPPTAVTAAPLGSTSVTITWAPTYPGSPAASYDALCVTAGSACTATPAGAGAVGGTTSATITGLSVGTSYTCYARASNAATPNPVCSVGVAVSTWTAPGPPTGVTLLSINETAATVAWTPPSPAGLPPATTSAKAVASGSPCTATAVGVAPAPAVGATRATIAGLPPRTALWVYAVATNAVASVCSPPLAVETWGAPGPAASVTVTPLTTTSGTVAWGAAMPAGVPAPTTYQPICVAAGQPCTAPPVATGAPSTTAPASSTVGGPAMTGGTIYTCYVLTSGAASTALTCSAGANFTTFSLPGPPGAPAATSVTGSSIAASWNATLSPPGVPAPALGLTCVAGANATCAVPGAGTAPAPSPGATTATVTGLTGGTSYSCFAFALSAATSPPTTVCSPRTLVKTWLAPGPPTNVSVAVDAGSEILLQWALPSPIGEPAAAVGAVCVARGAPCTASQVGTPAPPAVNATQGAVNGLTPNSVVTCYAVAYNSAVSGGVCSAGLDVTTGTTAPTGLTLTSADVNSLSFTWSIPAQPPPGAGYTVNCGPASATCLDVVSLQPTTPASPGFPGFPLVAGPGATAGSVLYLGAGTSYTCYAFFNSTTARYCSNAVTASTLPGPPPAVQSLTLGADYNAVTGTATWSAPLPRASPYFVGVACFPQGTNDPMAVFVDGYATNPVCTNPACWVRGGCSNGLVSTCFKTPANVWGLPVTPPALVPTNASLFMGFNQPPLGPTSFGFPEQEIFCYAYSISTDGSGVTASALALATPNSGAAGPSGFPLRAQLPSSSCGRPTWSDLNTGGSDSDPVTFNINWLVASTCGSNYGFPGGMIMARTVRGTLGINANRNSPELGTTCPAQRAWVTPGQCQYSFICRGGSVYYCSWTSTSNVFGVTYSEAICVFPNNPGALIIGCPSS